MHCNITRAWIRASYYHQQWLWTLYRITHSVAYITVVPTTSQTYNAFYQYPYSSMQIMVQNENRGQGLVQLKTNYD